MNTRADHIRAVSEAHNIPIGDLTGYTKRRPVVAARRELMHRLAIVSWAEAIMAGTDRLKADALHSLPNVGKVVRKDHTTVLYALRKHAERVYGLPPRASLAVIRQACLDRMQDRRMAA